MAPILGAARALARAFSRSPLFTVVAVLTLAVGIGANAAIFSIINGVLLKPLPFQESERLVGVWHTAPGMNIDLMNQGPATYTVYREENRVFEDMALWDNATVSVTGVSEPERVPALLVTDGLLPVLRVQPALGRRFNAEDDSPRSPERVMLSHAYWQQRFASDPAVVGRSVIVEGRPREVIGVLPAGFRFLSYHPSLLLPFRFDRAQLFVGNFSYQGVARLRPGVTLAQANADLQRMIPITPDRFPLPGGFTRKMFDEIRIGPRIRPLADDVIGDVRPVLWILLGTVGLVLLIACANVANLFLVRAEARQQELAIRSALGAGRWRLARELLGESVALGLAGGALGIGLAYAGIGLLRRMGPESVPRLEDIAVDPIVLLFTLALSVLAGLLFGLIPVLRTWKPALANALKEGGRGSSDGRERHRARNALVVAEIALALVLLTGSGLMVRTFQALRQVDPGFQRPEDVLTLRVSIPQALVADPERTARMHEQILRRIEQVPGVTSVGLSSSITMDGRDSNDPIFVEDVPGAPGRMPPLRRFKWTAANYFETMGNRLVAGRAITWADAYNLAPVAVITENLAREYWKTPHAALGRRIRQSPENPWREIVGVVGDERDDGLAQPATATVYWPLMVKDFWEPGVFVQRNMGVAIRSSRVGSPSFLQEIRQAVWSVSRDLPLANVETLAEIREASMAQTSFTLVMLGIASGVALLLGLVGIYGVISYIAAQRTREIGIRVALGARPADVSRLFLRHGLLLTVVGVAVGLAAAAAVTRLMASLLYGVRAVDPVTFASVAAGLSAIALLASYLPARRASRLDPMLAMRTEN